jgi:lipoate---protein ligase
MKCLLSPYTDIHSNLAMEEYLLMKKEDNFFILWKATPSVVVGKHQNALAEVNLRFADNHAIQIARRLSGGGTVFHDPGNLNFTFIRNGEQGKLVDFGKYINPVIRFLDTLGLQAIQGKKNEILAGGRKISGNAEHVFKNRVMHHGTLLFRADLGLLRGSLDVHTGRYIDKAVQSNRSEVANLSDMLGSMDMDDFTAAFLRYIIDSTEGRPFEFQNTDRQGIMRLQQEKYRTWEWIFGWSPDYELTTRLTAEGTDLEIIMQAHRGIITGCRVTSEKDGSLAAKFEIAMQGIRHEKSAIGKVWDDLMPGLKEEIKEELVYSLF